MSSSEKELAEQLVAAGNKLAEPPESADELLSLLEKVESCLLKIEQAPSTLIQDALSGPLKALVAEQLLNHSDVDVRVGVASCISEITRITAPEAPYEDDQMKIVFQLIVSSFEGLSDDSSRSYNRRKAILETVAKVRSCVVMLDLECDALILEMFQHFLKAIRDHHPDIVFSSMETIMTLVLEESEDVPLDLLLPLLAATKKDNKEVLPIARELVERVLEKCACKIKPYLLEAVKSLGNSVDDYSKVVAFICQEASGAVDNCEVPPPTEQPVSLEKGTEATSFEQVDPAAEKSVKSSGSNGLSLTGDNSSLEDSSSLKKEAKGHTDVAETVNASGKSQPESTEAKEVEITECNPETTADKEVQKPASSENSGKSDKSTADDEKNSEKPPDDKIHTKEVPNSSVDVPSAEAAPASENEKESGSRISSPTKHEIAAGDLPDEDHPTEQRINEESLKDEESLKEEAPPADAEDKRCSGKNVHAEASDDDKGSASIDMLNKESDKSDVEVKSKNLEKSEKKGDIVKSSTNENKKRRRKRVPVEMDVKKPATKDGKKSAKKDDDTEMLSSPNSSKKTSKDEILSSPNSSKKTSKDETVSSPNSSKKTSKDEMLSFPNPSKKTSKDEMLSSPNSSKKTSKDEIKPSKTPQKDSKTKRTRAASDVKEYGENLVGAKVKVWWPDDKEFYEGVIESFNPENKKHKVAYDDGDIEILYLKREKFEIIKSNLDSDEEETVDPSSPEASSESPPKKRAKTSSSLSAKQAKADASSKKGGRGSSSKPKGAAAKSGNKSGETSGAGGKKKEKSVNKSLEDDGKGLKDRKDRAQPVDSASKVASKSKVDDAKITSKSKGKLAKCSTKSDTNGGNGSNSGSKAEESVEAKEQSNNSKKASDSAKAKTPASSGRKRRRGKN